MPLILQQIITEAKVLVPNNFNPADQIPWLNSINQDFFSIVKIPKTIFIEISANKHEVILPNDTRGKNIDLVHAGIIQYRSLLTENVQPTQNHWSYEDTTKKLTLFPPPYQKGTGIVRYYRIATTTFLSSNLSAVPDAPEEYHWTYVPALCAKIALAQDDPAKAANYEAQYMNAWNAAAQEHAKELMRK